MKKQSNKNEEFPSKTFSEILDVPEEELKEKLGLTAIKSLLYRGFLPPPEWAKKYEDIQTGSFKKILEMTEKLSEHRFKIDEHEMEIEKTIMPQVMDITRKGQTLGFVISLIGMGVITVCAFLKLEVLGGIVAATTLINIVSLFTQKSVKGKIKKDGED